MCFQQGGQNVSCWTHSSLPDSTMWLAVGVFLIKTNQSVPLPSRKLLILVWSISLKALHNSFSAPMKLLPLSLLIIWIFRLLAITLCSAIMNESVSIEATTLIWTTLLAKHVKRAPYLFISLCLSFTRNGPLRSTPQYLNGGASLTQSFGKSTMVCWPNLSLMLLHLTQL